MGFVYFAGLFAILWALYVAATQIYLMTQMKNDPDDEKFASYGGFAVMTGCTDGIGKAYCLRMCRKISKFVLIGRNPEKLATLSAEMKKINPKVVTLEIIADFAGHVDYPALEKKLSGLDIGVFMNFVGVSYPLPQLIHKMDADYPNLSWDHINVNLVSATQLSRVIIPKMVERKSGLVVYVSSGSSTQPTPFQSSYAAGKKLLDQLAINMSYEYAGTGVDFQSIKPYYVATKLTQNKLQHNYSYTTMIPSAEEYTRQALGTIGRYVTTHGYDKGLHDL